MGLLKDANLPDPDPNASTQGDGAPQHNGLLAASGGVCSVSLCCFLLFTRLFPPAYLIWSLRTAVTRKKLFQLQCLPMRALRFFWM